ncbi:MAG: hypothetical protein RR310_06450 [Eubacterium sp.]
MSDMLNHYACGRESFELLPADSALNTIIFNAFDAYRLGTQGPDFFYYHHPMPWNDLRPLHRYGHLIHTENIDDFFYNGFLYALSTPQDRTIILSYLAGFSCHHSLDVATHPYIFYMTGHYDKNNPDSRIYSYYHKYFEVLLDVAYYQYEYGTLGCFVNLEKLFSPHSETIAALDRFYAFIIKQVYHEQIGHDFIKDVLNDTAELARLFSDPNKIKKHLTEKLENLIGEKRLISRVFYPLYTDELRILNLDHSEWQHPCTGEISTDTYPQLFAQAVGETVDKFKIIDTFLENTPPTPEKIHKMYANKCYGRALSCDSSLEMTHFNIIFEKDLKL